MKLLSWNVNGIRAVHKKNAILPLLNKEKPDIFCIQEIKAEQSQIPDELKNIEGYFLFVESAKNKKGYSGVALYTREKPENIRNDFESKKFGDEGRIQIAKYKNFYLYNIYFPNGKQSAERLKYKLNFYEEFLKDVNKIKKQGGKIIICGDVNTAHKEIDLARPKENEDVSGFLPEEREFLDKFLECGYIDTFRMFNSEGGNYTWWDLKSGARARNVGWRIDYFYISENLKSKLKKAFILKDVMGSDHCPIGIIIDI
jgi:exodeoxyribonuclease-3